jgi:hypothetical protein
VCEQHGLPRVEEALAIELGRLDDRVPHRMQGGTVGPQLETKQAGAQSQRHEPDDGQP